MAPVTIGIGITILSFGILYGLAEKASLL